MIFYYRLVFFYIFFVGLSPEYGLYSSFVGGFVYTIFGTCKDINLGPTSVLSLMMSSYGSEMGPDAAVFMCFFSGVMIFFLGMFNLGLIKIPIVDTN